MDTKNIKKQYTGERAQYFAAEKNYDNVVFIDGESPLKHGRDITVRNTEFSYKYPLWNMTNVRVDDSVFHEMGRSGIWYTENIEIRNTLIEAPKEFRRCRGIRLENVKFQNALETMWTCSDISLKNVEAKGDYFAMNSSNFKADGFTLDGNYFLDGGKDIEIHNSRLMSKDAFWNCENVTVYDSVIIGEYLGWYSKNLKFVNCHIESDQGLCYIDGLVLENCTFAETNLAFEYSSNIRAECRGVLNSVKNPVSGVIKAEKIGTLIMNPARCNPEATVVECVNLGQRLSEDPNPNER